MTRPQHRLVSRPAVYAPAAAAAIVLACVTVASCATSRQPITILVATARFASPEAAAAAADSIDWWDDDHSDDDAATESLAAVEMRELLIRLTGLGPAGVRISNARALPASGDVVVLGNRRSNPLVASLLSNGRSSPAGRLGVADSPDAFRLQSLARDGRRVYVIEGQSRTGALYGAYAFLEAMGVRFDGLGEGGTFVPRAPVALPERLARVERPAFETRGFWAWEDRGDSTFFRWMAHNRMNLWTTAQSGHGRLAQLGIRLAAGGHMMEHELLDPAADYPYDRPLWHGGGGKPRDPYAAATTPVDSNRDGRLSYFEAHPEWYGMRGGVRRGDIAGETGTNFCTSNRDAVHELARNLVRKLATGSLSHADQLNLWPLDNGTWCECAACRAVGGPSDRWLAVMASVHAELERAFKSGELKRRVLLIGPAFLETSDPPQRPLPGADSLASCAIAFFPYFRCYAHALLDPSCTEINRDIARRLTGWARALGVTPAAASGGESHGRPKPGAPGSRPGAASDRAPAMPLLIGEYYNVSWHKSLPLLFPHVMARDLMAYHRLGARHFHYMHAPSRLWGTWTLDHHVLANLLWNPALDVDSLIAAFVRRNHPSAPAAMLTFYRELERATANITAFQQSVGALGSGNARLTYEQSPVFPMRHFQLAACSVGSDSAASLVAIADAMTRAQTALYGARAATREPVERARLDEIQRRFDYGTDVFKLYTGILETILFHRQHDARGARQSFAPAEKTAERLRRVRDLVQVSASHANAKDGFEAAQMTRVYEFLRKLYGSGSSP